MSIAHRMKPLVKRMVTGLGLVTRAMTLGVRVAAFDRQGRVFLVRHSYLPGWYLPGGGVDPGETVEAAARREMLEEGGLGTETALALFGVYWNDRASRRDHVLLYTAREVEIVRAVRFPNAEILEAGFHALDALPEETTGATRRRLAEISAGSPASDRW